MVFVFLQKFTKNIFGLNNEEKKKKEEKLNAKK